VNRPSPPVALAWLTDIHLNFVTGEQVERLCDEILATGAEGVLISGDIAESRDLSAHLEGLAGRLGLPVYFVLGNHDYYHSGIAEVRGRTAALCRRVPNLHWLNEAGVVPLAAGTALVGHDGWSDARIGNYDDSPLILNDYRLIRELADLSRPDRRAALERFGDEAAGHLRAVLPEALGRYPRVLVVTHVPPFREACPHPGRFAWDDWLPHFTCRATGEALTEAAANFPDGEITVLCGHVHGDSDVRIMPNLRVLTGGAEYRNPVVQRIMTVE